MNVRELYQKLTEIDIAREDAEKQFTSLAYQVRADMRGIDETLGGMMERSLMPLDDAKAAKLETIMRETGQDFAPFAYLRLAAQGRANEARARAALLDAFPGYDVPALERKHETDRHEIAAMRQQISALRLQGQAIARGIDPVVAFNRAARGDAITPENEADFGGPAQSWRYLTDPHYRNARAAVLEMRRLAPHGGTYARRLEAAAGLEDDIAALQGDLRDREAAWARLDQKVSALHEAERQLISEERARITVLERARDGLGNPRFIDRFAQIVPERDRQDFIEAAVKRAGLEKVADFLRGRLDSVKVERRSMQPQMEKMRKAARNNGSKSVDSRKVNATQLDLAVAGTRVQHRYAVTNARAARDATLRFDGSRGTTSSDSDFTSMYLMLNMMMLNNANADAACTSHILGITDGNAATYGLEAGLQPDYSGVISDLGGDIGAALQSIQTLDTASLVQSVGDAVAAAATVSAAVDGGNFGGGYGGGYDGGGGGFSGGGDGGFGRVIAVPSFAGPGYGRYTM